jgi:hypothetical protein
MLKVHVCKFCKLSSEDHDYMRRHEFTHRGEDINYSERLREFEKNKALKKMIIH